MDVTFSDAVRCYIGFACLFLDCLLEKSILEEKPPNEKK